MIIVRLIGGLGNQLFQYAVGRRLAHVLGTELKLDITGFETYKKRKYYLRPFNIQENFASSAEIAALVPKGRLERALAKRWQKKWPKYIQQRYFHFDPDILNLSDGVYLDGYWQSEKYFADIAGIIHREFTVKTPQTGKDKELAEITAATESVSLSIRRGDYVSSPDMNQFHGVCDLDYYSRCVEHITQTVKNPHFFIFGDDPQWARNNLKLPYPSTLVDHNGPDKGYEDLRLISQCKHNIIANSSFSWWGAWLNPRNEKIVIAPKQWFGEKVQDSRKMDDLLPATWIVL